MKHSLQRLQAALYLVACFFAVLLGWSAISDMATAQLTSGTIQTPTAPTVCNVMHYGARGDARMATTASISGTTVTVAGVNFSASSNKYLRFEGAGTAGADLITSIVSGTNGSCTVADAASTPVASNGVIYWGTDDTNAANSAIAAAKLSPLTRTVYFPPGAYIVNLDAHDNIDVIGAGPCHRVGAIPTASQFADREFMPTVLCPADRTLPVAEFNYVYGSSIRRLSICGSSDKDGTGLRLGPDTGNGYWGHGCTVDQVMICGFAHGITVRNANVTIGTLEINNCTNGIWAGALSGAAGGGGGGKVTIGYIATHHTDRVFTAHNTLPMAGGITVHSGDFNFPVCIADVGEDSEFIATTINYEDNTGDLINMIGTRSVVDIAGVTQLRHSASTAFIANYGGSNRISVRGQIAGQGVPYKTAGTEYPVFLSKGMLIKRYTSTAWSTLAETEYADYVYKSVAAADLDYNMKDEFMGMGSGGPSPAGELGWTTTTIAGATASMEGTGTPGNGTVRIGSGSTSASNVYRFSMPLPTSDYGANQKFWEMSWTLTATNTYLATDILRIGLFSHNASITPTNGFGIRMDRSLGTPDATIKLIVLSGGSETAAVDTGVAYTQLGSQTLVTIRRTPTGLSCILKNPATRVPIAPEVSTAVTLPTSYLGPAIYMGSTGSWSEVLVDRFALRQFTTF